LWLALTIGYKSRPLHTVRHLKNARHVCLYSRSKKGDLPKNSARDLTNGKKLIDHAMILSYVSSSFSKVCPVSSSCRCRRTASRPCLWNLSTALFTLDSAALIFRFLGQLARWSNWPVSVNFCVLNGVSLRCLTKNVIPTGCSTQQPSLGWRYIHTSCLTSELNKHYHQEWVRYNRVYTVHLAYVSQDFSTWLMAFAANPIVFHNLIGMSHHSEHTHMSHTREKVLS